VHTSLLTRFLDYLRAEGASNHTVHAYGSDLRAFAAALGRPWDAESCGSVTAGEVETFLAQPCAPQTRRRRLAAVRAFLGWAVDVKLRPDNPAREVTHAPTVPRVREALTEQELQAYTTSALTRGTARDRAMVSLLVESGMQPGELLALRPADVVLKEMQTEVTIRRGRSHRTVILSRDAGVCVQAWIDRGRPPASCLFTNKDGGRLTARSVTRRLALYEVGVPVNPRLLRTTVARLWAQDGMDARTMQKVMGHSSLWLTQLYRRIEFVHPNAREREAR
jgi:site-specific recombinase XerD